MNLVYIYEGKFKKGDGGFPMIKKTAAVFCKEIDLDANPMEAEIVRDEKGKPAFTSIPVEFSLTHSGMLWMCMFSKQPCGIDLQIEKTCDYEKIAKKMYTPEERHYVELWGQSGFFDIWVRKEAFVKLTGKGLFTDMPAVVDGNADLIDTVKWKNRNYYFSTIEISDEIKCAVCTCHGEPVEIRIIG